MADTVYFKQRESPHHSVGAVAGKKDIPFYFEKTFLSFLID